MRVGLTDPGIELGGVFHQSIEAERRLPQPAGKRVLVQPHEGVCCVRLERHSPALQPRAVISRQKVEGHLEAPPVGGTRRPMAVKTADRDARGEMTDVHAGRFERLLRQLPIRHATDRMDVQAGGEHGREHVTSAGGW